MWHTAKWGVIVAIFAAACTGSEADSPAATATTAASIPASVTTTTPASTTVTEPPPPALVSVPAGVVWEVASVPSVDGLLAMLAVDSVPGGWMASGIRADSAGVVQPLAWHSADGLSWEPSDLSAIPPSATFSSFAGNDKAMVAVGLKSSNCIEASGGIRGICRDGRAVTAVSTDGGRTWQQTTASDDSFSGGSGGRGTSLFDVAVASDGAFVAVGHDERFGGDWPFQVWHSEDGSSWERVAELSTDWPAVSGHVRRVGSRLALAVDEAWCSTPFDNGGFGYVLSAFQNVTHVFWSDDGVSWVEDDLVAAGLLTAFPPDFDCDDVSGLQSFEGTSGAFYGGADAIVAVSSTGTWSATGPGSWFRHSTEPPRSRRLAQVDGTWVAFGFSENSAAVVPRVDVSQDLSVWDVLDDLAPRLPAIVNLADGGTGRISSYTDQGVQIVAAGTDESSGSTQPLFYRSEAALVDPAGSATCEPGPEADCSDVDFRRADLAGADFTGANLGFSNLRDADLTGASLVGADLTGAVLSGATLVNVDATGATFLGASFISAVFDGADFTRADFTGSDIDPYPVATWDEAKLVGLQVVVAPGPVAFRLDGTDLSGASFQSDITGSSFRGANLTNVRFNGLIVDVDFTGATLSGASMNGDLTGSRFANANIEDTEWYPDVCPDGTEVPVTYPATDCTGHFIDR